MEIACRRSNIFEAIWPLFALLLMLIWVGFAVLMVASRDGVLLVAVVAVDWLVGGAWWLGEGGSALGALWFASLLVTVVIDFS